MAKDDLSQLASSGLPSLGGSLDNPTWNRSLQELKVASDSLWAQSAPTGLSGPGNSLMGARRLPELDSLRLQGLVESNSTTQAKPSAEADFLCWEESNKRRELSILNNIVQTAKFKTRQKSLELYEKKEQEDWERKRDLWMKELVGTRNLGGSFSDENNVVGVGGTATALLTHGTSDGVASILPASRPTEHIINGAPADRFIEPQIVMSHLEIIKRHKGQGNFAETAANELAKVADTSSAVYATALRLVSRILSRQNFSSVEVALATLGHLSGQFDSWIIGRLRSQAGLEGQNQVNPLNTMYKSPNANTVASFVFLELGATAETTGLWRCLYYCLRIGDAVAAKEVFECTPTANESDEVRAAIYSIISSLAQRQGSAASMWDSLGPLVLPAQETRVVADAFDMSQASTDCYRTGVLSLLSGAGEFPTGTVAAGFSTIEDYLFSLLWKALQNTNPVIVLEDVGKTILKFGASYFDDQDSGGWSYSLPLLMAQQFTTALSYLVQAGGAAGMLQASHLGLLLESSGAKLENLGQSTNPPSRSLLTSLLVDYSNWLQGYQTGGGVSSLEYLRFIPNKNVMMDQVSSLILQTQEIQLLVGVSPRDGKRGKGALDNYFSPSDVSMLLKKAAERCLKDAKDREQQNRAAHLFMAAGEYKSVVVMLSTLVCPDADVGQNQEKRYWYDQSKVFIDSYLLQRSDVMTSLQSGSHLDAVSTFKVIIKLYDFFSLTLARDFSKAWVMIDELDILPKSMNEIGEKTSRYKGLDKLLQERVPSAMVALVQSLYQEHSRLKTVLHTGAAKSTTIAAMDELKERASALLTFAGVISVSQGQMEEMARIEASMI